MTPESFQAWRRRDQQEDRAERRVRAAFTQYRGTLAIAPRSIRFLNRTYYYNPFCAWPAWKTRYLTKS